MWRIIATSKFGTEKVDSFDTKKEARKMLHEYSLAYGSGWRLVIKKVK